jgi:formylmethanofuran dehydrogenase subunit A
MRSLSCIRIHVVEQWYQFGDEAEQQRRKTMDRPNPKPIMFRDGKIVKLKQQSYYDAKVVEQEEKQLELGVVFSTREQAIQKLNSLRARKIDDYSFRNDRYEIYKARNRLIALRNITRQKFNNSYAVSRHSQTMYRLEVLR